MDENRRDGLPKKTNTPVQPSPDIEPEQELRQTRLHFRELADFVHAIFWITSLDASTIFYVSPGYEKLWQRSLEDLCRDPRSWLEAVHPEDRERLLPGFLSRNIEEAWEGIYRILLPDGSTRWIRDRRYPVRDASGNVVRLAGISFDITTTKEAERELARYAQQLETTLEALRRRNRELDDFVYAASHDLKEPLRTITTFSHILEQDLGPGLSDDAASDLAFIVNAARRMHQLIDDLLALSRAGRAEMKRSPVSLRSSVDAALEALSTRIRETFASVEVGPLPQIDGDPTLLTLLFQNLLSNSLKFTSGERPCIGITATNNGESCLIQVADNGIGIDPEFSEKIFQPFRRVNVRPGQEGTGVGLALCRKVVERHGGRIWVESVPGQGARFLFTLPLAAAKESP